jgi:hypothetical protein
MRATHSFAQNRNEVVHSRLLSASLEPGEDDTITYAGMAMRTGSEFRLSAAAATNMYERASCKRRSERGRACNGERRKARGQSV